jgi:predicted MPP superfamily phosphohydrolase
MITAGGASLFRPLEAPAAALEALVAGSAEAIPVAALCVSAIGFWSARRFSRIREVQIPIRGLPAALEGFRIVQITDVHVGPTIGRREVGRIVAAANALEADLIALTGDLVDGSVDQLSAATQPLSELRARHGVCCVTGNHEYYSGAHAWITELRRLGLRVLMNEHVLLQHGDAGVLVAGISDYSAAHFDPDHASDPQRALAGAPPAALKLLLAHQPRSCFAAAPLGFDLQLSGHTHGGQFLPWPWFVRLQQPYTAGLHRLQGMWIYVSRGTGYWGPPLRLGAPSEITLLRLTRAH